jgi:hypothetical protein
MAAIFLGGRAWSAADYFQAAINALPGEPVGFTTSLLCIVETQAVVSATRTIFGQRAGSNPGWAFQRGATNTSISLSLGNASTTGASPSSGIAAADIGKLALYTGVWDGTTNTIRLYAKRVQVGAGTSLPAGFAPAAGAAPIIGSSPPEGIAVYGVYYAPGIATLAQIQAQHDAVMAQEHMAGCPGLPGFMLDLTQDIAANGGAMPATLTDRGTMGVSFASMGAPAIAAQYARAWTW